MRTGRLEAFSDGVIAILITVMVLELHVPKEPTWSALAHELPVLLAYLLSFVYLGIYWNNHHHLLSTATRVRGPVLWANLHLLFWLSLVPWVTGWMSEEGFATIPVIATSRAIVGESNRERTKSAGVTNPRTWLTDQSRMTTRNTSG